MDNSNSLTEIFGDYIITYTRAEAITDGVLIDVTETAKEAGFKYPVAITTALHSMIADIPKKYDYQDYNGRLWDVLWMAMLAARQSKSNQFNYQVIMNIIGTNKKYQTLKAICSGGDNGEPVITIMLPNED
jgi:hypothetical protein